MRDKELPKEQVDNVDDLLHTINGLIELANGEVVVLQEQEPTEEPVPEVDWDSLREMGFFEPQLQEIDLGLKYHLAVGIYAKECYNWRQMSEIRMGLMSGLDVQFYTNPLFTAEQMREIRLGLEENLDISEYAKLIYSASDMYKKRRKLLIESYKLNKGSKEQIIQDDDYQAQLRISADGMEAFVKLSGSAERDYTVPELKRLLKKYEVVYGFLEEGIRRLVTEQIRDREIKVAEGTRAMVGKDGWYKLFFKGNLPEIPKVLPDGRVDYSNVLVADTVLPQQLLAQYQPAKSGKEGMTVTGIPVEGVAGKELPPLKGQGILVNEEQGTYKAERRGYVSYDEKAGTLNVFQIYMAEGDVNRYSGSVIFDGSVHIKGSVSDMAVIKATGDIIVDGFVGGAVLSAGNNVMLRGGVNSAGRGSIEAGGKIMGDFFERVTLKAQKSIEGNYFLNCNVETDAKLIAKGRKASIQGGTVTAAVSVESAVIGNPGSIRTRVIVGDLFALTQRATQTESRMKKVLDERDKLTEGKEKLLKLYGEEAVLGNKIYQKTCLAIEVKNEEWEALKKEAEHIQKVKEQAVKANVRVTKELHPNVVLSVNGTELETRETYKGGNFTKEKLLAMLNTKK